MSDMPALRPETSTLTCGASRSYCRWLAPEGINLYHAENKWEPGSPAIPVDDPKIAALSRAYRERLAESCAYMREKSWAEAIAIKMTRLAFNGNIEAASELADRAEGGARQFIAIGGAEEQVDVRAIIDRLTALGASEPVLGVAESSAGDPVPSSGGPLKQ